MLHSRARFEQWLPAGFDGQFDWDFLLPAFVGTKIRPMDIDADIERNGKHLIFETKDVGKQIDLGQQITLTDHWRKGASIIHLAGKTPRTIQAMACYWVWEFKPDRKIGDKAPVACNWLDVLFVTRKWFCFANGIKIPTREEWENKIWIDDYEAHIKLEPVVGA